MSNQVTTSTSPESDPLVELFAFGAFLILGTAVLESIFNKPEPKRTISGHSEADFAEIIRLLEKQ